MLGRCQTRGLTFLHQPQAQIPGTGATATATDVPALVGGLVVIRDAVVEVHGTSNSLIGGEGISSGFCGWMNADLPKRCGMGLHPRGGGVPAGFDFRQSVAALDTCQGRVRPPRRTSAYSLASMIQSPALSTSNVTPERARPRTRSTSESHPSGFCNRTARPLSLRSTSRKPAPAQTQSRQPS